MLTAGAERDVIVVGGGPGGSAAAHALAAAGWRVLLLERSALPRDKSCGDGLTRRSLELLDEMGAGAVLAGQQAIDGVHLVLHRRRRARRYPRLGAGRRERGAVVPRRVLDAFLCRHAVAAGAELWEHAAVERAIVEAGVVRGVEVVVGGARRELRCRFVVAADGATSRLARQVLPGARDEYARGFALRGYFEGITGLADYFEFRVPLAAPREERLVAGYGWVFPLPAGRANIGVGYFPSQRCDLDLNVRRLYEAFVAALRREAPFRAMAPVGAPRGAPLACHADFERCHAPGLVLVGDAAGLVDPFTGEGIDTALESGRLAARVIDAELRRPADRPADLAAYGRLLAERYGGRFRTGKRFIRHHGFMWKLLVHTDAATGALYDSLRSAVVDFGAHEAPALRSLAGARAPADGLARALDELAEAEAHVQRLVSEQFPLLSKAMVHLVDAPGRLLRPALVLAGAALGATGRADRVEAASCLQLAKLAFAAHTDVIDGDGDRDGDGGGRRDADADADADAPDRKWCNMFAVMAGDHLAARALELAARLGPSVTRLLSEQTAAIAALRLRDLERRRGGGHDLESYLALGVGQYATFYATASELGAEIAGVAPGPAREALRRAAIDLGTAARLKQHARAGADAPAAGGPAPRGAPVIPGDLARRHLRAAREHAAALPTGEARELLLDLVDLVDDLVDRAEPVEPIAPAAQVAPVALPAHVERTR